MANGTEAAPAKATVGLSDCTVLLRTEFLFPDTRLFSYLLVVRNVLALKKPWTLNFLGRILVSASDPSYDTAIPGGRVRW